jgi:hypothetical protein
MQRIYQNKSHENRFAQLFMTDTTVIAGSTGITALLLFTGFENIPFPVKILITVGVGLFFFITYTLVKPFGRRLFPFWITESFNYIIRNHNYTFNQLATMSDFYYTTYKNYYYANGYIFKVFVLKPLDITSLSEQEKAVFNNNMTSFLHKIDADTVQFFVANRRATEEDYETHFRGRINRAKENRAGLNKKQMDTVVDLTDSYIADMRTKIQQEYIPFKEYYFIVKERMQGQNEKLFTKSKNNLNEKIHKYTSSLTAAKIKIIDIQSTKLEKQLDESILFQTINRFLAE